MALRRNSQNVYCQNRGVRGVLWMPLIVRAFSAVRRTSDRVSGLSICGMRSGLRRN